MGRTESRGARGPAPRRQELWGGDQPTLCLLFPVSGSLWAGPATHQAGVETSQWCTWRERQAGHSAWNNHSSAAGPQPPGAGEPGPVEQQLGSRVSGSKPCWGAGVGGAASSLAPRVPPSLGPGVCRLTALHHCHLEQARARDTSPRLDLGSGPVRRCGWNWEWNGVLLGLSLRRLTPVLPPI